MKCTFTAGWEDGIADLTQRLIHELTADQQVLWLLSGGSNIPASVQIMKNIPERISPNLTIMLIDERFGPLGHNDSNATQLSQAGFNSRSANFIPTLQANLPLEETRARYEATIQTALTDATVVIAQVGIGEDGHLAGILPNSPAASETAKLVAAYEAPPLTRLTLTFPALEHVTAAYAFAFGDNKHEAISRLVGQDLPIAEQPAQILKRLPEAYVYTDQIEEDT